MLCPTVGDRGRLRPVDTVHPRAEDEGARVIRTKRLRGGTRSPGVKAFPRERSCVAPGRAHRAGRLLTTRRVNPERRGHPCRHAPRCCPGSPHAPPFFATSNYPTEMTCNVYGCPSAYKRQSNLSWNFGIEENAFTSCDPTRPRSIIHRTGSILKGLH